MAPAGAEQFGWISRSVLDEAGCLTLIENADGAGSLAGVAAAFGADLARARQLPADELASSDLPYPATGFLQLDGWTLVVEHNGWQGSRPEVLRPVWSFRLDGSCSSQVRQRGASVRGTGTMSHMTLEELLRLRPAWTALAVKYGLKELAVFGSTARGDATPASDVDFLYVRGPGGPKGFEFLALQSELEDLLGRKVDLVPRNGLHWVIRDQVLEDAKVLYAA